MDNGTAAGGWKSRLRRWGRGIKADVLTLWYASRHPNTPILAKVLAVCLVAYAFSPIDLIPDFIPVLGLLDDAVILPLGIIVIVRLLPSEVLGECRAAASAHLVRGDAKPRSYIGSITIVAIWTASALMAWAVVRRFEW